LGFQDGVSLTLAIKARNRPLLGYPGRLDIERIDLPTYREDFIELYSQNNDSLSSERINASGGVEHPPFHFDFPDVQGEIKNAHAFEYEEFAFIVVTLH
jgi:hypothetical protein